MRVAVTAADLAIGDTIAGVGKVRGIVLTNHGVAITLDWATVPEQVLSPDHVVWIDKDEHEPIGGAA